MMLKPDTLLNTFLNFCFSFCWAIVVLTLWGKEISGFFVFLTFIGFYFAYDFRDRLRYNAAILKDIDRDLDAFVFEDDDDIRTGSFTIAEAGRKAMEERNKKHDAEAGYVHNPDHWRGGPDERLGPM